VKENGKQWKHVILVQSQSQTQQPFFSVATCPTKAVHLLWPFQGFDGGHGMQALRRYFGRMMPQQATADMPSRTCSPTKRVLFVASALLCG